MTFRRILAPVLVVAVLAAGCGDGDAADQTSTTEPTETTDSTADTTTSVADATTSTTADPTSSTTTDSATSSTDSTGSSPSQPALWPSSGVVLDTPEAAAADFVSAVLGVPAELADFREGDARSGEIDVLSPGEGGGTPIVRSTLLMRQLGPDDGWFVIGAINDNTTIESPGSLDEVSPGPIDVSGKARGFEAAVLVEAYVAGETERLDQVRTAGGSAETPEPYDVTLDLSGTTQGQTVVLLVKGGVGLETDPGEFSAIPVVVG